MANVSSWLAKGVVEHDRIHGSNLEIPRKGRKWLVQITKFHTYRTPEDPRAQITGLISDRTHTVPVEFDVDATDKFERYFKHQVQADSREVDANLEPERLTSNLRALMNIESYRWKVGPPRERTVQGLEMPTLKMEILEWSIYLHMDLPVFFEDTVEVGWGKDDGAAQKVLRKWYFGESNSDMSEIEKSFERSQPEAGPSRLTMSSPLNPTSQQNSHLPHGVITFADFLEPYISDNGAKKGKPIPEWIFETSKAVQVALDQINVFGVDWISSKDQILEAQSAQVDPSPTSPGTRASQHPQTRKDKGKGKETAHPMSPSPPAHTELKASAMTMSFPTQTPPVPLAQHVMSTQPASQQFNLTQSPLADNEESESDGEIPVVPLRRVAKPKSRPIFDPLAFPPSSGESVVQRGGKEKEQEADQYNEAMDISEDEADSEDLSDYEREARQQRKRKRTTSPTEEIRTRLQSASHPHPPVREVPPAQEDESIPASESIESLSLTKRYPSPSKTAARPIEVVSSIVQTQGAVDHGVHSSLDKNGESLNSNSNESSLPTPPPSDHDQEAPLSMKRSVKIEERPVIPKTEPTTLAEHRRAKSKSSVSASRIERDGSRSSRTAVPIDRSDGPGPSRRPDGNRSRMDGPGPSTSTNITLAQSIRKRTYILDLTIDGLSKEEVEQYTAKVNAARAKTRPT